jgi:hypothetical protein
MQITLNEDDISKALTEFLANMGVNLTGKKVTTAFTAGRGVNGNTATLTIEEGDAPVLASVPDTQVVRAAEPVEEQQEELDLSDDALVFEEG